MKPQAPLRARPAVFGFAGWSGSGKTTLIEQLIPRFVAAGVCVSLIKHAHHEFDIDQAGKDSFRHRHAGCTEVLISSAVRWALMHELRGGAEQTLAQAISRLSPCDLVLVEGYKKAAIPKLEIYRATLGKGLLHPHDAHIVAVASDAPMAGPLPSLGLDQPDVIATFILDFVGLGRQTVDSAAGLGVR